MRERKGTYTCVDSTQHLPFTEFERGTKAAGREPGGAARTRACVYVICTYVRAREIDPWEKNTPIEIQDRIVVERNYEKDRARARGT